MFRKIVLIAVAVVALTVCDTQAAINEDVIRHLIVRKEEE